HRFKPHFVGKGFLTWQDRGALQVALYHNDDCFITGQLLDLAFQGFQSRKITRLFTPVSADKLIPSVLLEPDSRRGHYAISLDTLNKLFHIFIHSAFKRMVWELVNLRSGDFPYLAQGSLCTTFVCFTYVVV